MVVDYFRKALRQDIRHNLENVVLRAAQVEREAGSICINAVSSCNIEGNESQEKPASDETSQQRVWKALNELVLGQNQLNQTIAAMQAHPRIQNRQSRQPMGQLECLGTLRSIAAEILRHRRIGVRLINLMELVSSAKNSTPKRAKSGKRQWAWRVGQPLPAQTQLNRPAVQKGVSVDNSTVNANWYNKFSVLEIDQVIEDLNVSGDDSVF